MSALPPLACPSRFHSVTQIEGRVRSGVHGVEMLFVTMGTGCTHVSRTSAEDYDVCVGTWGDGRIGTFRGSRSSNQRYGGQVSRHDIAAI